MTAWPFSKFSETIVAQRDYVGCGRSNGTRHKKTNHKKKHSSSGTSKTIIASVVAILITFISGIYFIAFITHNKSEETVIVPNRGKHAGSGLPPKPEERWRYIKELENRQIGVQTPTKPTAGKEVNSSAQLTGEQCQLLKQMQADMRQKSMHLNKVPYTYNNQSKLPVAGTMQQCANTQSLQPAQPVQRNNAEADETKKELKEKPLHWLVQCGSFKEMDQAEVVRAQLAFAGLEGRVTTDGSWNRVLLGPYSSRSSADKILQSVHDIGVSNCIPISR